MLGRKLKNNECVHHMDGNTKNNDLDNLQVVDKNLHLQGHAKMKGIEYVSLSF